MLLAALCVGLCTGMLDACEPPGAPAGEPNDPEHAGPVVVAVAGGAVAGGAVAVDEVRVAPVKRVVVPDEELVDQDGVPVRLPALMKDRIVAVNFVFTTCTTICSPMTAIFGRLQRELGDALERDVRLVTISLDPATDTPERLRRYADKFDRRPGWTFLTGPTDRVGRVLDALRGETGAKEGHSPVTLLGSAAAGRWARVYGLAPAERLHRELQAFLPAFPAPGSQPPGSQPPGSQPPGSQPPGSQPPGSQGRP
jgi:protein SCO1/2